MGPESRITFISAHPSRALPPPTGHPNLPTTQLSASLSGDSSLATSHPSVKTGQGFSNYDPFPSHRKPD